MPSASSNVLSPDLRASLLGRVRTKRQPDVRRFPAPGDLAAYVTNGAELDAPHLQLIDAALIDAAEGRCPRLLIEMPPRHGKSRRASRWGPAWFLARFPDRRVILTSYEADFAATWGRQVREVIDRNDLGVRLARGSSAADRWDLAGHEGGMVTAGVGGSITGRGAHLLIVDDPVKNHEEAHSQTMRDKAWDWWQSTALTRLEPKGAAVVIMTRWHEDDLAGRILAAEADRWRVLRLPAVAEAADQLGRCEGAALWPERYDAAALDDIRRSTSNYVWSSLYQQRPSPEGGSLFRREWFRYWTRDETGAYLLGADPVDPASCYRFATIDLAVSLKTSADWTVMASWAVTHDGDLILLDRERVRVEEGNHWPMVRRQIERNKLRWLGVESRMFGTTLVYEAGRNRFPVRELKADADKFTRALPASQRMEAGRVWFPADVPWLPEWEHELLAFPNGTHDDQVDVLAYAAREIVVHGRSRVEPQPPTPDTSTLQGRVAAEQARLRKPKRHVHPILGR